MNVDDIIYISLLLFSMAFGYYYRPIKDKDRKKWIGTGAGVLIILMVSGVHILHNLITLIVNSIIILFLDKRYCLFGYNWMEMNHFVFADIAMLSVSFFRFVICSFFVLPHILVFHIHRLTRISYKCCSH